MWDKLSDDENAKALEMLRKSAEAEATKYGVHMEAQETKYFLLYTDLKPADAAALAALLDKAYGRLADLFSLAKGQNIWHGKALAYVFRRTPLVNSQNLAPVAPVGCKFHADGTVEFSVWRQRDDSQIPHALIHEMATAFLWRLHKPGLVVPWVQLGFCEAMADDLAPVNGGMRQRDRDSLSIIEGRRGMSYLFNDDTVDYGSYDLSESVAGYMLRASRKRYAAFILGMKDGMIWQESLEKNYGVTRSRLTHAYGQSLGINIVE